MACGLPISSPVIRRRRLHLSSLEAPGRPGGAALACVVALAALSPPSMAHAQEAAVAPAASASSPGPDARPRWRGQVGASMAATSGNTDSTTLLLNMDLNLKRPGDKTTLTGHVNEGRTRAGDGERQTSAARWDLSGQYDHDLNEDWFGFTRLGFERDRVTDLSLRTLVAAGLGYHVLKGPKHTFDVSAGLSYTDSRWNVDTTIDDKTGRHFTSVGLLLAEESSHELTDAVTLKQRLEAYPGVTGAKSKLLRFNASLNVAMTKALSLSVGLVHNYDGNAAEGREKNDTALFTGVNLKVGG
jgi:putative salt-induced outer membrane protein